MISFFIIIYLLITLGIGYWASKRIKTSGDLMLAGKNLSTSFVGITLFATWFGSSQIMGISICKPKFSLTLKNINTVANDDIRSGMLTCILNLLIMIKIFLLLFLWSFMLQAQNEKMITTKNGDFPVIDLGKGTPVLLLHGFPDSKLMSTKGIR